MQVGSDYYRVIGVMEPGKKRESIDAGIPGRGSAANRMFIPLETAKTRYESRKMRSGSLNRKSGAGKSP